MVKKYSIADYVAVAKNEALPPNCDITLQLKVNYAENGIARGVWQVDEKFLNGNGVAMGGFQSSAADIMMAYAVSSLLNEDQTFATIDLHSTYHRPIFQGDVEVVAEVKRLGRKVAYVEAELVQNNKLAASMVSSIMIM